MLGWLFLCGVDTKTKSTNLGHMLMLIDMIDRYIHIYIYIIIYIYIYIYIYTHLWGFHTKRVPPKWMIMEDPMKIRITNGGSTFFREPP